jgi:hypothetical protein
MKEKDMNFVFSYICSKIGYKMRNSQIISEYVFESFRKLRSFVFETIVKQNTNYY